MEKTLTKPVEKPVAPPVPVAEAPRRRVLIVEDDQAAGRSLKQLLEVDPQLEVHVNGNGTDALKELARHSYSILLTDLRMPGCDGMDVIRAIQMQRLPVTVIVTTGYGSIDEAVQAMRMGAYDFLTKPIDIDHLRFVIQRALRERALQDEVAALRARLQNRYAFHNIISKNPQMHNVFELISHVADTNTTILIEGETGTGKEQVAWAIHESSNRRPGPMVALNCAAVPESLLESELFGHEKGSFTSAISQRRGRFELAHGGTLFLDEIGDVPAAMQAKLLRVLQDRRFERVGGTETIEVNVRVIAASNRLLQRLVKQGTFREDLYFRLNVVKISLPPLRDRPEDIPLLATYFAGKYARPGEQPKRISPEAMEILIGYHWAGNVRELENAIERASVTSRDNVIQPENLGPELLNPNMPKVPFAVDLQRPLPELIREATRNIEHQYIRKALKKAHGHVGRCARICGLSRRSISDKIAEYNLDKSVFKEA